jgi:hypothetical protein
VGIGVVILQTFISAGARDVAALVSLVAFAIALPRLVALIILNRAQDTQRRYVRPWYLTAAMVGQNGALIGVAAAFWRVQWLAGMVLAVSRAVGPVGSAVGYQRPSGGRRPRC